MPRYINSSWSIAPIVLATFLVFVSHNTTNANPSSPPPNGFTGGIFSYYFKNIIEGSGSIMGTTNNGVCPTGRVITGFSTQPATYGLPICTPIADGAASSLTGNLVGTVNYLIKYGATNTGLINSQIFDNGINIGVGTITPSARLTVVGGGLFGSTTDATTDTQSIRINSRGYAGLSIRGDSGDSSGEPGGAFIDLGIDNTDNRGTIGVVQSNGIDGRGLSYSGTTANNMLIGTNGAFGLQLGTNSQVRALITPAGNVNLYGNIGIGSANPVSTKGVNIGSSYTTTSGFGIDNRMIAGGTYGASRISYGNYTLVTNTADSGGYSSTLYGDYNLIDNQSITEGGGSRNFYGGWNQVTNNDIGNITNSVGMYGRSQNSNNGTISNSYGIFGVSSNSSMTGIVTNSYGGHFSSRQDAGTITNSYGIRIGTVTGENTWGLYQDTTTANNFFGGNLGIKTNSYLQHPLTIRATSTLLPQMQLRSSRSSLVLGSLVGGISFSSDDTSIPIASGSIEVASILALANTTHTTTALGTDLIFNTTTNNTLGESMRITGNGDIGIGTSGPSEKLHIVGNIRIENGSQGSGKVLMSNSGGVASWQEFSGGGGMPIGTVMAFNGASCPAGWTVADGTSGTPDLRGEFIRGLDSGRGIDTGRALGSWQNFMMQSHTHGGTTNSAGAHTHTVPNIPGHILVGAGSSGYSSTTEQGRAVTRTTSSNGAHTHTFTTNSAGAHTHTLSIDNTGGTETRPRNVALLYCIKISGGDPTPSDNVTWMNMSGTSTGNVVLATTGNVGIGTSTPTARLTVQGGDALINGVTIGRGNGDIITNTALGRTALQNNTTGYANISVGVGAMAGNTTGYNNTVVGINAMNSDNTGFMNVAIGQNALQPNTSGYQNVAIGVNALLSNTTGQRNTVIGMGAGTNITAGNDNIAIGAGAIVPGGSTSNVIVIGAGAFLSNSNSNQVRIGNNFITYASIQVPWTITSDRTLKSNIENTTLGLDFIRDLNPVSYTRNNDIANKVEYGFIAQDVNDTLHKYGITTSGMVGKDDLGIYSIRYNDLLAPMVKSIQELARENADLKRDVKLLLDRLEVIEYLLEDSVRTKYQ